MRHHPVVMLPIDVSSAAFSASVKVSSDIVGASLTLVTVIVTVAVSERVPSLAVMIRSYDEVVSKSILLFPLTVISPEIESIAKASFVFPLVIE